MPFKKFKTTVGRSIVLLCGALLFQWEGRQARPIATAVCVRPSGCDWSQHSEVTRKMVSSVGRGQAV